MIVSVALLLAAPSRGADGPCFRGPAHDGTSAETGWAPWGAAGGPRVAWKAQVGVGFSSFVVAGGRLYRLGFADDADTVACLDAESGKPLWTHSYPCQPGDKFVEGGTTGTRTVDGDRV